MDNGDVLSCPVTEIGVVGTCLVGTHGREFPRCEGKGVCHLTKEGGRERVPNSLVLLIILRNDEMLQNCLSLFVRIAKILN